LVCGFGGLVVVFRKWKREGDVQANADDAGVVAAALRDYEDPTEGL
jgi:hypothetical protein